MQDSQRRYRGPSPCPPRKGISLRAPAEQHNLDGLEHDHHVEAERHVLEVIEIVLQLLFGVLKAVAVLVAHLGPTCDSRPDRIAYSVKRNLFCQHLHKFRTLWARPDKAHIALEHAPQLRNLIESRSAEEFSDFRDARVIVQRPGRAAIGFCVLSHGSKLVAMENFAA